MERKYKRIVWVFTVAASIFFFIKVLVGAASIICMAVRPAAEVLLTDTGTSYQADLILGYMSCDYGNIPVGDSFSMVNSKVFCITFVALATLIEDIPMLVLFLYVGRILKKIQMAHSPFSGNIVKDVRRIGKWMLVIGLFQKLFLQLGMSVIVYHTVIVQNVIDFAWVFAGIITLFVAGILEQGCELQQFSDETL